MSNSTSRPIRYVVLHEPGPKWQYGVDYIEYTEQRRQSW